MPQLMIAGAIAEQLKAADQMKWVGRMNMVKIQAGDIIIAELIYSDQHNSISI